MVLLRSPTIGIGQKAQDVSYVYNQENIPVHLCDEGLYERAFYMLNEDVKFEHSDTALKDTLSLIIDHTMPYEIEDHLSST